MSKVVFQKIGVARESESPENPGGREKRAVLVPKDVRSLVEFGCEVYFEKGLGEGIGFSDEEYLQAGAVIQSFDEIYRDKDLVIKFKGPSFEAIEKMNPGTTLFCMAHFRSFPKRAKMFEEKKINVVAMEWIVESPKKLSDEIILSKKGVMRFLENLPFDMAELNLYFLGYDDRLVGGIRRAGNRNTHELRLIRNDYLEQLLHFDNLSRTGLVFDSKMDVDSSAIQKLRDKGVQTFDLSEFESERGVEEIENYRKTHPPHEFGLRRIQCLHETGQAGARYGFHLLKEESGRFRDRSFREAKVVVFGYGNVGMGAIHECSDQGVNQIDILTRRNTDKARIGRFIEDADLIVNGAEPPRALRGKNYLLSKEHVKKHLKPGAVVIDLVGGSASNRSPVENVVECTFLTNPFFVEEGVYFAALWGWPMMGMMKETAIRYSSQIREVLIENEMLIEGLSSLHPGVKPALACGPHDE